MFNPKTIFAKAEPIAPKPIIPIFFPDNSVPIRLLGQTFPSLNSVYDFVTCLQTSKRSARVNSAIVILP